MQQFGFSRRRFLTGLGIATALSPFVPLLNATGQENARVKRLLLLFTPDGTAPSIDWMPQGSETDFTFHAIHRPLDAFKSKIVVPWGLRLSAKGAGEQHAYGMAGLWTGSTLHPAQNGVDFDGGNGNRTGWGSGPSIDQEVARAFGPSLPYQRAADDPAPEVPFRTLELGVQSGQPHSVYRMIYRGNEEPLHPEMNPRAAFDRLFGGALAAQDPGAVARLRAERGAVLDLVKGDLNRMRTRLGAEEFRKVDNHMEGLRAIERRLQSDTFGQSCTPPAAPAVPMRPGRDNNGTFRGELTSMMDIVASAFACDLTRVASLQVSRGFSNTTHTWLGHTVAHHTMSHDTSQNWDTALGQVDTWYAEQVATLLARLDAIPENGGTLLDNTLVVWGRELGNTAHRMDPLPVILAGGAAGGLSTGRFLRFGDPGNGRNLARQPHAKLLTSIGKLMGLDIGSFGNIATGAADQGSLAGIG